MITIENVVKFLKGEKTWAEVEGITAMQANEYKRAGYGYMEQGDFERAGRMFECLITINPQDVDSYAFRGVVHQAQEQNDLAIRSYDAALAIDSRHVLALANRGELRMQLGDQLGITDLQRAAELDPMGRTVAGKRAAGLVRALKLRSPMASKKVAKASSRR